MRRSALLLKLLLSPILFSTVVHAQQAVSLAAMNAAVLASEGEEIKTEATLNEKELLVRSTSELVLRVAELRAELEGVRQELLKSNTGKVAACLRCAVRPEWKKLPIGALAPFSVEAGLCADEVPGADAVSSCISPTEYREKVQEALLRSLSALESLSCRYLSKQLGGPVECPEYIGGFYTCSMKCQN